MIQSLFRYVLFALVLALMSGQILAQSIEQGVTWLNERETVQGVHQASDIAAAVQTNAEAWRTLELLQQTDAFDQLRPLVLETNDQSLVSIATQARIRLDQGLAASSLIDSLLAEQLGNGAFPSHPGFQGDPLTTSVVLQALDRAGRGEGSAAASAISYLAQSQNNDGGWRSVKESQSSVYASAQIALTLISYRNRFELTSSISRVRTYLFSQQQSDQSFGSVVETALTLLALLALDVDRTQMEPIQNWLQMQQLSNGSFGDDAFETALALRALYQLAQPVSNPGSAGLTVRIVAADTLLPIAGAELVLTGTTNATLISNDDGRVFTTSLIPGPYQASVAFSGFQPVSFEFVLLPDQLSDLGEIRLTQAGGGDNPFGIVRGTVLDSDTGEPIGGATIRVLPDDLTAVSDAAGRFQILQVMAGPIELRVNAPEYSSLAGLAELAPNSILEFSAELTALDEPLLGTQVRGTVRSGQTEQPLADIQIEVLDGVSGNVLSSTMSDTSGQHIQEFSVDGLVDIVASGAGFDTVAVRTVLVPGQVYDFSPFLYPTGQTPPGANSSRIVGVIVNQANRQPIENALLVINDPGGQQTVRSAADGSFIIDDLAGPNTSIEISADAFDPARLLVPILPLETRDVGEVSLKPTALQFYFPDLVMTGSSLTSTDPDTYLLQDQLTAEITNQGTSGLTQDFDLMAFIDANEDGEYQPDTEPEIGFIRVTDDLPIGSTAEVSIAVDATLTFRDAPFALVVDFANEVPEQDETNNVATTLLGCRAVPAFIGDDGIFEAWRWDGLSTNPQINSISQVPAVGQLTDDNGDGRIDQFDVPDIVFVAGLRNSIAPSQTALVAISGDDGREHWARTDIRLSQFSSPALGDIDNDGVAEIVVVRGYREEIIAFEHDGELKWRTGIDTPNVPQVLFPPPPYVYDMPIIVNLEGDNEAEVILGRLAYRGLTGEQLWEGQFDGGGIDGGVPVEVAFSQASVAADIDLDGITDVIAGRTLYDFDGNTVWHRGDIQPEGFEDVGRTPQSHSGYVAVGNFDLDDFAEIILAISDELYLLEHTGETIWGPVNSPDFTEMGAPTIIDLDDDGLPEIITSSNFRVTVFETDGTVKWTADVVDNSGLTSATVFDFENDGLFEIMHIDEEDFRIFDARTGTLLYETRHISPTVFEFPIVADVDADKQAEIILTGYDFDLVAGVTPGLRVFKARDGAWADAGSVWGSHAFHINDVNEDSTVPLIETPSWLTHNTYRVQRSPMPDPLGRPDFTLGDLRLIDQGPGNLPTVQARVGNAGPVDAHEPPRLGVFRGDPADGGILLTETRLDTLRAARFQTVNLGEIALDGSGELFAVIDYPNLAEECREGNNQRSVPFQAANASGSLQLLSDASNYAPDDPVVFTVGVGNTGGITASYRVELELVDTQGEVAATFAPLAFDDVASGDSVTIDLDWVASGLLGGTYTLNGELRNALGQVIDTAGVTFTITGAVSGPAASLALQTQQVDFLPGESVEISMLARNSSDDTVIELPRIAYTITDPSGTTVQSETLLFSDLFPGTSLETQVLAENTEAPGLYTVSATLRSALSGQVLATASVEFTRLFLTAANLQGSVDAVLPRLIQGQTQTCLFRIENLGSSDILNATVRQRVVSSDTQTRFEFQETTDLLTSSNYLGVAEADTAGYPLGDYLCLLELADGPDWIGLGADAFVVEAPPPAGISVEPPGPLETTETGQTASFSVVLLSEPSANVVIPLEVSDASEWSLSASQLTFTPATWNIARTVVVTGLDDDLVDGNQTGQIRLLPAQSADDNYAGLDADDIEATNQDDDGVSILVAPLSVTTSEDGSSASVAIRINAEPSAPVTIDWTNPDDSEWLIEPLQIVFDDQNWQTPQSVLITGLDDDEFDDAQTATLMIDPAQSADPAFAGIDPADVELRNDDNEVVSIQVEPTEITTSENGPAAEFVVSLAAEPTAAVTIPVGFVDASEWQVPVLDIVLDAGNWQAGQTVTVTPVDDALVDGTQTAVLELGIAQSNDMRYAGIDPDDVTLINNDDDGAQILVTPTTGLIVEETGTTATFEVVLSLAPSEPVVVPITSLDIGEFSVSTAALEFTPTDGTTPQVVTVTGVDDAEADGNIIGLIEVGLSTSADPAFNGIDPADVSVTNLDDETVEITVLPEGVIETDESGLSATIELSINHAPTADIVIDLAVSDGTEWSLDTTQVVFTPADWVDPREVIVTGVDDDELDGPISGLITVSPAVSADLRYNGLNPRDVVVLNRDDEVAVEAEVLVTPIDLITSEAGDTGTLSIALNREPTAPVTLSITSLDTGEITIEPGQLVFEPGRGAGQQVELIGVDDALLDGPQSVDIVIAVTASGDPDFAALSDQTFVATNLDNEVPVAAALLVTPIDLVTSEAGDGGSLTLALSRVPTAPVNVSITSADTEEIITQPTQLVLTDTALQTIDLLGVDDVVVDGPQSVDIVIAVTASDDPDFAALADQTLVATNLDDDRTLQEPLMVPTMSRWSVLALILAVLILSWRSLAFSFHADLGRARRSRG